MELARERGRGERGEFGIEDLLALVPSFVDRRKDKRWFCSDEPYLTPLPFISPLLSSAPLFCTPNLILFQFDSGWIAPKYYGTADFILQGKCGLDNGERVYSVTLIKKDHCIKAVLGIWLQVFP